MSAHDKQSDTCSPGGQPEVSGQSNRRYDHSAAKPPPVVEAGTRTEPSQHCRSHSRNRMPTYEYHCKDCGHEFETQQAFSDDPLTECPSCSGVLKKKFGSVGISFKGSGFYKNDSRGSSSSSSTTPSSSTAPASTDSSSSDSSSSPAPSTPAPAPAAAPAAAPASKS